MKFKKSKKPKTLKLGENEYFTISDNDACAYLRVSYPKVGPRQAIKMARWLERYAKWSSLACLLLLTSCTTTPTTPPAPVETPAEKVEDAAKPCARGTWCAVWTDTVKAKITPSLLNANYSSFCSNYKALDKPTLVLNFVKAIAWNESEWDPNNRYVEKTQGIDQITGKRNESVGLLQMSCGDVLSRAYRDFSSVPAFDCRKDPNGITDPVANLNFGLDVMSYWAKNGGSLDVSSTKSIGAYWSSARLDATKSRKKMKELMKECK